MDTKQVYVNAQNAAAPSADQAAQAMKTVAVYAVAKVLYGVGFGVGFAQRFVKTLRS